MSILLDACCSGDHELIANRPWPCIEEQIEVFPAGFSLHPTTLELYSLFEAWLINFSHKSVEATIRCAFIEHIRVGRTLVILGTQLLAERFDVLFGIDPTGHGDFG